MNMVAAFFPVLGFVRRSAPLYVYVFVALGLVIVYADKLLEWRSAKTGRAYGRKQIAGLSGFALLLAEDLGLLVKHFNPEFSLWMPLAVVAGVGGFRLIYAFLTNLVGLD
jgi:hypothetical protein